MYHHLRHDLQAIFRVAVRQVVPRNLLKELACFRNGKFTFKDKAFDIDHNIHIVGFGKAVYGMAKFFDDMLMDHITSGVISVPLGTLKSLKENEKLLPKSRLVVMEGARKNLPDEKAENSARMIVNSVSKLRKGDLLLVLISGGGSALLPLPIPPMTIHDKSQITKLLSKSGASIQELNTVRKHISQVKGGKLALMASPATVVTMIISDVIGDPMDIIAGGPTVQNTGENALKIISKYKLEDKITPAMKNVLNKAQVQQIKPDFDHVHNFLVGNNTVAAAAAAIECQNLGYKPAILNTTLEGKARIIGAKISRLITAIWQVTGISNEKLSLVEFELLVKDLQIVANERIDDLLALVKTNAMFENKGLCLIFGGETVVEVTGSGIGGRNQELALSCAININSKHDGWMLLSAGTDGIDGPTNAAGAMAYQSLVDDANEQGITNVQDYLDNNDSNGFYKLLKNGENLVVTGHTGTNVMDLIIVLLTKEISRASGSIP